MCLDIAYLVRVPRSKHLIRVVPPSLSKEYAQEHDSRVWKCFCDIMNTSEYASDVDAKRIATVPGRNGGLGLRSAARSRQPAFLASWMDALPILDTKLPALARNISAYLSRLDIPVQWSLYEVKAAQQEVRRRGGELIPSWEDVRKGNVLPPQCEDEFDVCEWKRGWQYYTCSVFEAYFRNNFVVPLCTPSRLALLHS